MHFAPVVPPFPSPNGGSGGSPLNPAPPVIPHGSPNNPPTTPAWAQQHTAYPQQSPYGYMASIPGSYFIPPVALPNGQATPMVGQGFSMDYTGFPPAGLSGSSAGTPYTRAGAPPGTPYMGAPGPQTGYSTYQQLPHQSIAYPVGMMGAQAYATPYMAQMMPPGMTPGVMGGMAPGMGGMGGMGGMAPGMAAGMGGMAPGMAAGMGGMAGGMAGMIPGFAFTPAPGTVPMPGAPPMQQSHSGGGGGGARPFPNPKEKLPWDELDKFMEGEDYGPVLKPMIVYRMRVKIEVNPLIQPPNDALDRDYLKWNMLFPSGNCQRSSDRPGRSWHNGRGAPATWPRVTLLRLISRSFPWTLEVPASDLAVGVTCGDVIEAIHTSMYTRLSQQQYDHGSKQQKRLLSESFYHNRSTAHGVPGGRLQQTLLRCDWLGQDTMFGGIVDDERVVREICRDAVPCTFEFKCVRRYPMTEAEIRDQEARDREEEERTRRRSRSRATSRAASSRPSTRPPTRPPSRAPPDDDSSTTSYSS